MFSRQTTKADPAQINQIKTWAYELLHLNPEIPISISQLRCTEPDCPPVETVIAVMTTPIQQYKIHKPVTEIDYGDIAGILPK